MKNALYNVFKTENHKTKFAKNFKSCRKSFEICTGRSTKAIPIEIENPQITLICGFFIFSITFVKS
jgi:hypothetical protein